MAALAIKPCFLIIQKQMTLLIITSTIKTVESTLPAVFIMYLLSMKTAHINLLIPFPGRETSLP
jgi:hypothetical protein